MLTPVGAAAPASGAFAVHPTVRAWGWRSVGAILRQARLIAPDVVLLVHIGWIYGHHPMVTLLPSLLRLACPRALRHAVRERDAGAGERTTRAARAAGAMACAVSSRRRRHEPIFGTLLRKSDAVIVLCRQHLDALARVRPEVARKATLIPAPPIMKVLDDPRGELRRANPARLGVDDATILLGTFGYVYRSKGLATLVRALALAGSTQAIVPRLRLGVIGGIAEPDYGDEVKALARELGVEAQLIWTGHCAPDADDASVLLHAVDVCVFPCLTTRSPRREQRFGQMLFT